MNNDLGNYRKIYQKNELSKKNVSDNPMELFQKWFYEVEEFGGTDEANAMTIATIGTDGFPKNRVVLLKKYTWEGFIFYAATALIYKGCQLDRELLPAIIRRWIV